MTETRKKTAPRRAPKTQLSGQRSLLDLFPVKSRSKPYLELNVSEVQESEQDTMASCSNVELIEVSEGSSCPIPTDVGSLSNDGIFEVSGIMQGSQESVKARPQKYRPKPHRLKPSTTSSTSDVPPTWAKSTVIEGSSRDIPITIDSSPSKPAIASSVPPKPVYSIFASHLPRSVRSPTANKITQKASISYPDRDSQHVRGSQTQFPAPELPFGRRPDRHNFVLNSFSQVFPASDMNDAKLDPIGQLSIDVLSPGSLAFTSHAHPLHVPMALTSTIMTCSTEEPRIDVVESSRSGFDPAAKEQYLETVPSSHLSHPAITRLFEQTNSQHQNLAKSSTPSQELWADKWRPRCAEQVIGNEDRALYLREWLLALKLRIETINYRIGEVTYNISRARGVKRKLKGKNELSGSKRPQKILRQVDKRKRRKRLDSEEPDDSWIVDDDKSEDDPLESEDEAAFCQRTLSRLQRASIGTDNPLSSDPINPPDDVVTEDRRRNPPQFGNEIHNTILLAGPSGSGKTAAVYACAEELGWDVFEVYPGIGERSGTALNKLIGEVGKNHLVKQTQRQQTALSFDKAHSTAQPRANGTQDKDHTTTRRLRHVDPKEEHKDESTVLRDGEDVRSDLQPVSQSIVLVEEVDVLYESDTSFWPALINIIKDCRRPVVMTCNDISLIPIKDLPLQDILMFAPCPAPLATSYLQCLSFVEHRPIGYSIISRLYQQMSSACSSNVPDRAPASPPDLRHAINQLQLGVMDQKNDVAQQQTLKGACDTDAVDENCLQTLRFAYRHQETVSYADCYLTFRSTSAPEVGTMFGHRLIPIDECSSRTLSQLAHLHPTTSWVLQFCAMTYRLLIQGVRLIKAFIKWMD
ncbi:hypothetical protein AcW1_004275 [Taiwanofungus camphoratus]|nr:hypothetical protein AcW2_006714 [Antrodia cinnamomea]KAI0939162.1 hypothetical protein AcV5_000655 [Antrodia cinnamomea]KAI0952081.1 hypothetical protein AcV7_007998 [Antrodia cinnamomea]KAI0959456.1 hypothetical protein AcW1_004275 [Antrodia cinnamomea]